MLRLADEYKVEISVRVMVTVTVKVWERRGIGYCSKGGKR